MKWKKLGRVFDPTMHELSNNCLDYAQSPQTLVFENFVRIYFSTREKDKSGKFLSHISFVDMDKSLDQVLRVSTKTVIELGGLGCFDEHGIFPINVVRRGETVLAYTCGWSRRRSVPVETSIGFAISEDEGSTFRRLGDGPILTASLDEPFLVGDPFVFIQKDVFHMWYIYGTQWVNYPGESSPGRTYKIGHATSSDGVDWLRENRQLISDKLDPAECQALPTVINFDQRYHMFFCYRQATDFRSNRLRAYRIGYAFSENLKDWVRDDSQVGIDVSEGDWDSDMLCYPHVFRCNERIYLLYNGNEFGRFGFGAAVLEQ